MAIFNSKLLVYQRVACWLYHCYKSPSNHHVILRWPPKIVVPTWASLRNFQPGGVFRNSQWPSVLINWKTIVAKPRVSNGDNDDHWQMVWGGLKWRKWSWRPKNTVTLWLWLTVRHGIDGPFIEIDGEQLALPIYSKWWIFPWQTVNVITRGYPISHTFTWAIKNTPIPSHEILVGW